MLDLPDSKSGPGLKFVSGTCPGDSDGASEADSERGYTCADIDIADEATVSE